MSRRNHSVPAVKPLERFTLKWINASYADAAPETPVAEFEVVTEMTSKRMAMTAARRLVQKGDAFGDEVSLTREFFSNDAWKTDPTFPLEFNADGVFRWSHGLSNQVLSPANNRTGRIV